MGPECTEGRPGPNQPYLGPLSHAPSAPGPGAVSKLSPGPLPLLAWCGCCGTVPGQWECCSHCSHHWLPARLGSALSPASLGRWLCQTETAKAQGVPRSLLLWQVVPDSTWSRSLVARLNEMCLAPNKGCCG